MKIVFSKKIHFKEQLNENDEELKILVIKIPYLFSMKRYHIISIFVGDNNTIYTQQALAFIAQQNIKLIQKYTDDLEHQKGE